MRSFLFIVLAAVLFCKGERLEFQELPLGGDAELVSQDGGREKLSQGFRPATLLFFGFSRCPDFCPMTLHRVDSALKKDSALVSKTRLLFISVDSPNEKPEDLKKFLSAFPYARGYTGTAAEIAALEKSFGAHSQVQSKTISHSLYLYVLNSSGKVVYLLRHDDPAEKILQAIRQAASSFSAGPF
jgi:protein SCO1